MNNEKEKTAVEWLIKKLTNRQNGVFDGFPHLSVDEIYEQAKEMEKEQIKDAYYNGTTDEVKSKDELLFEAEHFYNETYGGNK
jgi:hypothetical protein